MSLKREGERGAYALVHGTWICKGTIGILTLIQKTCTDWGSTDEYTSTLPAYEQVKKVH